MKVFERDTFYICGYSVETTAAKNDEDISPYANYVFFKQVQMNENHFDSWAKP